MMMCSHGHVWDAILVRQSAIVAAELYVAVIMEMESDCIIYRACKVLFRGQTQIPRFRDTDHKITGGGILWIIKFENNQTRLLISV